MKKMIYMLLFSGITTIVNAQESNRHNFAIKFTPTQLVSGEFNLGYEQRIARFVSLELNGGPTISEMGVNRSNHSLWVNSLNQDDLTSGIGYHVSIEPRFYLLYDEYEMRGLYMSAYFKYRTYNTTYSYDGLEDKNGTLNQLIYRFNIGFQFWPGARNFCLEMFSGFGFGTITDKYYKRNSYFDNSTNNYIYSWEEIKKSKPVLNGVIGVKIGFGK